MLIVSSILIFNTIAFGQLDLSVFESCAHHWYDIPDKETIIEPLADKPRYKDSEIIKIADNVLLFQKSNGGWAKNYDMQAILTPEQVKKVEEAKNKLNTTFDNGATHSHIQFLAEVYTITKDEKYKTAFLKGLDFIFSAQYKNGGWPQYYPDRSGYRKHITYNDGAMIGVMNVLFNIIYENPTFKFLDAGYIKKASECFTKGIECILNTQITEDGKKNVWCQQHDNATLLPTNARTFEPAAICNKESSEIVLLLMKIKNPSEKIKNSIQSAVSWFKESAISGIRIETVEAPSKDFKGRKSNTDKIVIEDKNAPIIWARFYELKTHVPLFCNRDGVVVYSLDKVERERRTGYGWYNDEPKEVLKKYPKWLLKNN